MNALVSLLLSFWWVIAPLVMIVSFRVWVRLFGVVMIPEDSMGVVNKMFALVGAHKTLPDGTIIALNGEAGYQADTLAPGLHFGNWPWPYQVTRQPFITVPEGQVGVVERPSPRPRPAWWTPSGRCRSPSSTRSPR